MYAKDGHKKTYLDGDPGFASRVWYPTVLGDDPEISIS
jgi:hypothetical protein